MKIRWYNYLKKCIEEYPKESGAAICSRGAYTDDEVWHVLSLKNTHKKPESHFCSSEQEWKEMRKAARLFNWNYLGIIHTHPYPQGMEFKSDILERLLMPSKRDIKNATCRDLMVCAIIVCDNKSVLGIRFHSPFSDDEVKIYLESDEMTIEQLSFQI